jgi:signal transduction histidine kinase
MLQSALFERLARQNEEILERKNVIRDIVYALAHDIRTPLAAANTTMRQALSGSFGPMPERYAEVLGATIASNDELRELAETLLLVARYELGETSNHALSLDLSGLCAEVERQMQAAALERAISFDRGVNGDQPAVVLGDSGELRRAILNLVSNAFAATPRGGHVTMTVTANEANVSVEVRDDGYGVPEERRPLLFGRFQSAPLQSGGGTGLGLYLARRIAEKYGGTIEYRPAPERGSIFTMTLPRAGGAS